MDALVEKLGVAVFVMAASFAAYKTMNSHYGVIYVDLGDGRGPAAVRRGYDVSGLDGRALSRKMNDCLVGDAHILRREGSVGLELGQFVARSDQGKRLACSIYDRVQMVFQGEGEATDTHRPEMLVEGNCDTADNNILWMKPIWIPVDEILKRTTATNDLSFYDAEPVSLKFTYLGEEWPRRWILNSIRLYHSSVPDREIIVDREEIREVSPKSIVLDF